MKKLLNKQWFTGLMISGIVLIIFFINYWILSMNLTWSYDIKNIISMPLFMFENDIFYIFAYVLMIVFYLSILSIILALFSFYKKNVTGFVIAGLTFLGLDIALIVFKSISYYLPFFASILLIINIVLILFLFTLIIIRKKTINSLDKNQNKIPSKLNDSKIPFLVLLIDIIALLIYLTTFFIPLYTLVDSEFNAILINVLFSEVTYLISIIAFFINFIIFIGIFLHFMNSLSYYLFNKERFIILSKKLINSIFIATAIFFIAGLVIDIYITISWGDLVTTISYIPLLLISVIMFIHAIIIGKFRNYLQITSLEKQAKFSNLESLLYTSILTSVTVLMLFLKIIKININSGSYSYLINLTGFEILRNYSNLDSGYRMIAYLLFIMLISVGLSLIIVITSYLSKSKLFYKLIKFTTAINIFFVFIIAMSGYYFQIAREINKAIIIDMASFYGYTFIDTSTLDYTISTEAIYALIVSVIILIIMFARKVFDREDIALVSDNNLLSTNQSVSNNLEADTLHNFDPCYAFTELDNNIDEFNLDLKKRQATKPKEASLNGLVKFIVEYARNSRLHLSYDNETIATFVAGLGASKLTILQGMSGTGKTSLPKIFAEAIYGNCDIIEVESSWKDKNELLGYYNEFSLKYTPKKFTLALYKAALNQEIFTFILLDEMNLSRIEYYFSDFLSLMENEENFREIKLVNIKLSRINNTEEIEYTALKNGHTLKIPHNIWFIGTANRDESTFVISDKVYDRAHTMNFTKRAPKVRDYSDPIPKQYYDYKTMNSLFENAKANGNFDAENNNLIQTIETLLAPYNISFGNRILKQIEDFVNIYKECFPDKDVESEAIEKILLSKVVSKLEVKTIEDKEKLIMEFEKLGLYECTEFIKHLDED